MHVIVIFINIGSYHAIRLEAAHQACQKSGWHLTAIQVTDDTLDHPWGDFVSQLSMPVKTLLPVEYQLYDTRKDTFSAVAGRAIEDCLTQLQPDAVFLPGWSFSVARAGLKWCRRHNSLPILMSETKKDDAPRFWWQEVIKSWIVKQHPAALVGGKPHKRYLIELGMLPDSIFMGYDVVGNNIYHPTQIKLLSAPFDRPYFLAINRFVPKKNLEFLLSSYVAYQKIAGATAWDLVLCGDGNLLSQIKQQIIDLGLNNSIHLPGFLKEDELLPYFAHANCFIHASIQEQWGLVVNEAMAAGLPVLVSKRCGCFEDLVNEGINGFGFDPENQQELTQLMVKMSSGEVDLQVMGKASLEHIQNFSPDCFGQGVVQAVKYCKRTFVN